MCTVIQSDVFLFFLWKLLEYCTLSRFANPTEIVSKRIAEMSSIIQRNLVRSTSLRRRENLLIWKFNSFYSAVETRRVKRVGDN